MFSSDVMNAQGRAGVETKLKSLEDKSSVQFVVVTVKSLEGGEIETYANELFRFWKLGEVKKNHGLLLLVAPTERKVRIVVGHGLEGILTDALSSGIIQSVIIPRFQTNDFPGGIERGADGIISVLTGEPPPVVSEAPVVAQPPTPPLAQSSATTTPRADNPLKPVDFSFSLDCRELLGFPNKPLLVSLKEYERISAQAEKDGNWDGVINNPLTKNLRNDKHARIAYDHGKLDDVSTNCCGTASQ